MVEVTTFEGRVVMIRPVEIKTMIKMADHVEVRFKNGKRPIMCTLDVWDILMKEDWKGLNND